jgi:hypothetical protein
VYEGVSMQIPELFRFQRDPEYLSQHFILP